MSVVSDYLQTVEGPEHDILVHMYEVVRGTVPEVTEITSYNMPAFALHGKAFLSIMANKNFMSIYPFSGLNRLGLDFSDYETTTGSIHFTPEHPVSDDLLRSIIHARLARQ